tara:strand:+ start:270 stop:533 length:264 start_codon:yes stop_codon:yes gene_type:complete
MSRGFFLEIVMTKEEWMRHILGQGGALVIACAALWYISQLYVDQINGMMLRCDSDRVMYQNHMEKLSIKLEDISRDVRDIKENQVNQ